MNSVDRALEFNFRHALAGTDRQSYDVPTTAEDLAAFIDKNTLTKLAAWAVTTQYGLKHKLTDMAIQAVK